MINPAKPEIKAARPRTYATLWDTILAGKAGWLFLPPQLRPFLAWNYSSSCVVYRQPLFTV